jgi:hypothetical protein
MTSRTAGAPRDPHDDHDREAIAALAAGDATGQARELAEQLVVDCAACAVLVEDLRAIAAATRALPSIATAPRDFRLTASDAARLRGGLWQRLGRAIGVARWSPRPFAAAFTTLGIAALLIAVVPFAPFLGGSGGAGQRDTAAQAGAPTGAPSGGGELVVDATLPNGSARPSSVPGGFIAPPNGAVASPGPVLSAAPEYEAFSPAPTSSRAVAPSPSPGEPPATGPSAPLVIVGFGFLAIGVGLFLAGRRSARGR